MSIFTRGFSGRGRDSNPALPPGQYLTEDFPEVTEEAKSELHFLLKGWASKHVTVNFWHLVDAGRDSVDLLDKLVTTYGAGPNYIVVKNQGRGADFSGFDEAPALKKALALGAQVVTLGQLHEASMRKIDCANASFWAAINTTKGENSLGMLERQRVKMWLKGAYSELTKLMDYAAPTSASN